VGAVVIVEVDEPVVGEGAMAAGGPWPDVGPFRGQDPVETFDFAVRLRLTGSGLFLTVVPVSAQARCQSPDL
jgi:hypothetical protein